MLQKGSLAQQCKKGISYPFRDAQDLGTEVWPQGFLEYKHDLQRGVVSYEWRGKSSWETRGVRYQATEQNYYEINDKNPEKVRFLGEDTDTIELPGRTIFLLTNVEIASGRENFYVVFSRQIFENDKLLRHREWKETIRREFQ